MPTCTGLPITAPSISCLDYFLHWDLSGATPIVTITNNSTVLNAANLKWWFYVVSPNGTAIYGVDLNTVSPLPTPDVSGVAWTTKVITLTTPFGNPPCGQIEFSSTNPFNVYVYVQDIAFSTTTYFTWNKNTLLPRPNGNCSNSCGNFGTAAVNMKVDCLAQSIMVNNGTNQIYNNILTPASTSNVWTLVYPQNASGDIPNVVVNNQDNVNFVTSINSAGYVLYFQQYATYNYGNGITVTVQYKLYSKGTGIDQSLGQQFAINCNTNLCLLQCQMQKFYKLSKGSCGTLVNADAINKMTEMSFLFNQIIAGIFQPLCGIDVPKLMAEIKAIGNFDDNCDCNCNGNNFGFSNPTGPGTPGGSCCPLYASVININTGVSPVNCASGYFPANVYAPNGTTVIGNATSMSAVIAIINAYPAWQALGTAFDAGNCQVGFFPASGVTVIPNVVVNPNGGGTGGGGSVIVPVVDPFGYPPCPCPAGYFPAQVYNPTGATIIGVASDINSLVGIINANSEWQAIGVAYVVDNCHVGFYPAAGVTTYPNVIVTYTADCGGGGTTSGCVGGKQNYPVTITDICSPSDPPITASSFPINIYVDFGLGAGPQFVGNATSQVNMIALLNAFVGKPASVTFAAGATVSQVVITNSNCTAYSGVIAITTGAGSNSFLLFGGNHIGLLGVGGSSENEEYVFSVKNLAILGKLTNCNFPWHNVKYGNYLLTAQPNSGYVFIWDMTNPLMPFVVTSFLLNTVVSGPNGNFTGNPHSVTIASAASSPGDKVPSIYSLYFPTDYNILNTSSDRFYIVESLTGTIWRMVNVGTGFTQTAFQDNRLIGKCPRIVTMYDGNVTIFFTQDGDLEQATSQSSGVATGDIVVLNTATFSSGGLSTILIFPNDVEYAWAASYDGVGNIYFTGNLGSIGVFNVATSAVTVYNNVFGAALQMSYRASSSFFNGYLYITPQHFPAYNGMILQVSTLGGTPAITQFQQPAGGHIDGLFNFLPLGNCLGILTSAAIAGTSPAFVGLYRLDGTYLSTIPLLGAGEEFYNVVAIPNVSATTPNNYLPAP